MKKIITLFSLVLILITAINIYGNENNEGSDIAIFTDIDTRDKNNRIIETGFIFSNDDHRLFPVLNDFGDDKVGTSLIVINGKFLKENAAFIESGYSLVPVRNIMEEFGATIEWENETKSITILKDDIVINLKIGETIAIVNGEVFILTVAPQIVNNSTYVPLAFISEILGYDVSYWSHYLDDVFHSYINIIAIEEKNNVNNKLTVDEAINIAKNSFNQDILGREDEIISTYNFYDSTYYEAHMSKEQYTDIYFEYRAIELGRFYSIDVVAERGIDVADEYRLYTINRMLIDMYTGQRYYKHDIPDQFGILNHYYYPDGVLSSNMGQFYEYLQLLNK